jgi:hypothetical protein
VYKNTSNSKQHIATGTLLLLKVCAKAVEKVYNQFVAAGHTTGLGLGVFSHHSFASIRARPEVAAHNNNSMVGQLSKFS